MSLSESVEVRVWDSTAEMRYLVLPRQPSGTEHLGEEELSKLVTRDAMIGVEILLELHMNSIHDMGGMHGFGPIVLEEKEPDFHTEWEGRVYAMV